MPYDNYGHTADSLLEIPKNKPRQLFYGRNPKQMKDFRCFTGIGISALKLGHLGALTPDTCLLAEKML